ncbi:MAG TPA: MFS transporter [Geodermatophilus sp.]|nr:MFS transporter [Geodermatophilus sp.]
MTLTAVSAGRRFVVLTALRWLPLGLSAPVTVLLASARGLSPADIGVLLAVYSTVTLLLELPTGGLADAIGHRPVLVLSGLLTVAGLLTMVVADGMPLFAVAWALHGAGRALDSGPLEAWYVDAVHAVDPTADVTTGLSRAAAADGAGLALGAVLGGLVPLLAAGSGSTVLALPLLLAAALGVVSVVAVLLLVVPLGTASGHGGAALRTGVRAVPAVVRDTARLVAGDLLLRRLLAISLLTGTVLTTLELLGPLHFADLAGSPTGGSAVFGIVMAASFAAAAGGALLAPAARRAARGPAAAGAALAGAGALSVTAVASAPHVVLAAVGYVVFYLTNAAAWPLRKHLLHGQVPAGRRATTVSATSLALMVGGLGGSLLVPRLAEAAGNPAGFAAGGVALLLIALISVGLRPRTTPDRGAGTSDRASEAVPAP